MSSDARRHAEVLHKAMEGWGTDEKKIIHEIVALTTEQIHDVKNEYKHMYGKDLMGDIQWETTGTFESLLVAILTDPVEYDAKLIHDAIKGLGTSDKILIEVFCSRHPDHLNKVHAFFDSKYGNLIDWIRGDTSGSYQAYLVAIASGKRDPPNKAVDAALVEDDVKRLYNTGEGVAGTVEETWVEILSKRNGSHIRGINKRYEELYNRTLETVVKKEFSGTLQMAFLYTLEFFEGEWEFFARRIHESMVGVGTSESELIRIFSSQRYDLEKISKAYHKLYTKSLQDDIAGEVGGDFQALLLAMINAAKGLSHHSFYNF
jgi:annexin A7/11